MISLDIDRWLTIEGVGFFSALSLLFIFIIYNIKKALYYRRIGFSALEEKGFVRISKKKDQNGKTITRKFLKVVIKKDEIIFKDYAREKTVSDFIDNKVFFEELYNCKFIEITSQKRMFSRYKWIVLKKNNWKKNLLPKDFSPLSKWECAIGDSGRNYFVTQDFRNENLLFIAAAKGTGKGNAIRNIISSFYGVLGYRKDFKPQHELILVDNKKNEYLWLQDNLNAKHFNSSYCDQIKALNKYLTNQIDAHKEFQEYLNNNRIIVDNWLDLNPLEHPNMPSPFFLVIDEALQLFRNESIKKPSKDSSQEVHDYYEFYLERQRLSMLVNKVAEYFREYGSILIISTQDPRSSSMFVDISSNFKTKLVGQLEEQMSMQMTGSRIAVDRSLRRGKMIYIYDEPKIIQTPYLDRKQE